jgi:ribonuclease R
VANLNSVLQRALEQAGRPLGIKELLRVAGLNPGYATEAKRVLRELVRAGALHKEGKRFSVPGAPRVTPGAAPPRPRREPSAPARGRGRAAAPAAPRPRPGRSGGDELVGILHVHPDGFGFVHPMSGEDENVYVPAHEVRRALDGDRVRIERVPGSAGRSAGRIVEVVDRVRQRVIGTYLERGRDAEVEPRDRSVPGPIRVPRTQMARHGDQVKVVLGIGTELLSPGQGLTGEVSGSLGRTGDPSVEVLSIAYSQGFSDEFPPEVMAEADRIALKVSEEEATAPGRRDLRKLPLVTIDGEDARDFDDAVYVEARGSGYRLVVAIADVSHYVREGTALDAEALRRATSVYLPDRVLPMLPERLSNGICSLRPDEDRLCMVADMQLSAQGQLESSEIYPGVMRSVARCTYNEVQAVLDGEDVPHRNRFLPDFEQMQKLARLLTAMRMRRGAIDFDLPESRVVVDEEGQPARLEKRERKQSHRIVEEFMLAANEAVAGFFQKLSLPSVYRFHGEPDEERLATFAALAGAHGFYLGKDGQITSGELNAFVQQLVGHPEQRALNQLLLRSMMQAVYSSENVGHYGLAAEHYLHFTSPIRRYPDLLVHRLLKRHWANKSGRYTQGQREAEEDRLEGLAAHCSERERGAMQVEREVHSFYAALLMKDRVGEEFEATVASVTDFGFFVELDGEAIEGLVKGDALGGRFDPTVHAMVLRNGQRVKVGQHLTVRLASVSIERRQIDFDVVRFTDESGAALPPPAKEPAPREPRWSPNRRAPRGRAEERRPSRPMRGGGRVTREALQGHGQQNDAPDVAPGEKLRRPRSPERPVAPAGAPWASPPADDASESPSPHPGFDRLRALAAQGRKGRERPPPPAQRYGRHEEVERQERPSWSPSLAPRDDGGRAPKRGKPATKKGRVGAGGANKSKPASKRTPGKFGGGRPKSGGKGRGSPGRRRR